MLIFLGNNKNKAIVLSHCTGMGPGPVQGQMESTLVVRDRERDQDLLFPIVPFPFLETVPVPFPCSVTIP